MTDDPSRSARLPSPDRASRLDMTSGEDEREVRGRGLERRSGSGGPVEIVRPQLDALDVSPRSDEGWPVR